MGFIIKPNGGTTYPNIADDGTTVSITPSFTNINCNTDCDLIADNALSLHSNSNGDCYIYDFSTLNIDVEIAYILANNVFIVPQGGKLGFFSNTIQSTQYGAISNATTLNYLTTINNILAALRSYNLIQT
jgi:hypothetical protein